MFLALITYYLTYLDKYLLDSEFHNALEHLLEHGRPFHKSFPGTKNGNLDTELWLVSWFWVISIVQEWLWSVIG